MARINVEDHKKAIFTLNGIPPFEEEMTFYYDESGNCRKFSLTDAGFNNTDALKGDFVLAGVAHEGRSFDIDGCSSVNLMKSPHYLLRIQTLKRTFRKEC